MEEFFKRGYTWSTKSTYIEFHNPVFLGEKVIVRTWVQEIRRSSVEVHFKILKNETEAVAAEGYAVFVLINISTGKPDKISEEMIKKYSI
jgi:acyl-CoA thioesterase FadM